MKSKSGWLFVILIASVQLALLLIAVVTLFGWFANRAHETFASQACAENGLIANQIFAEFAEQKVGPIQSNGQQNLDLASEVLSGIHMPNYGFVCLVDPETATAVASNPKFPSVLLAGAFSNSQIENTESSKTLPLLGLGSKDHPSRYMHGSMEFNQRKHYVTAQFEPKSGAIILVAQQPSQAVATVSSDIRSARQAFFAATMLIGLCCLAAILMVLNRITAKVETQNANFEDEISNQTRQVEQTQNAVIFGLAKLAESRDNDTGEHLDRIRSYVMILAKDLQYRMEGLDDNYVRNLALASSLHDVGKVGIPDSILLKPGRLSKAEREVMELHTLIGGECLEAIQARLGTDNQFMQIAKQVAYYHHERWDGNGYPHGLAAEKIPVVARIVAVADVYDALTSKRPYKDPLSHIESKGIILSGSGSQFDPEVVAAFLRHEDEFEAISRPQRSISDEEARSEFHVLCERAQTLAE